MRVRASERRERAGKGVSQSRSTWFGLIRVKRSESWFGGGRLVSSRLVRLTFGKSFTSPSVIDIFAIVAMSCRLSSWSLVTFARSLSSPQVRFPSKSGPSAHDFAHVQEEGVAEETWSGREKECALKQRKQMKSKDELKCS